MSMIDIFDYEIERTKRDFFICAVGITILAIIFEIEKYGENTGAKVLSKKQRGNK